MTKFQTVIWTWKLAAPLGLFWRTHQLVRSLLIPYHKLLNYLPPEGTLLDLGCGHGIFLALAKISNPDLKITGLDLSQSKVDSARLIFNYAKMEALSVDALDITNYPDRSVDVISIIDVFYLVPLDQWGTILDRCYDCLKQGGVVIFKEMDRSIKWKFYLLYFQELLAVKLLGFTMGHSSKFIFPAPEDIKGYLEKAGFKKIEEVHLDRGYYIPHKLWIGHK